MDRPRWDELRKLAKQGPLVFGWPKPMLQPYREVNAGIWHCPLVLDVKTTIDRDSKENTRERPEK